jgi:hypothetical protein
MFLLYILGGLFAGALLYAWAKTSNSFTAYCITEAVAYVQKQITKLRGKA